jgi:hypothetical protein
VVDEFWFVRMTGLGGGSGRDSAHRFTSCTGTYPADRSLGFLKGSAPLYNRGKVSGSICAVARTSSPLLQSDFAERMSNPRLKNVVALPNIKGCGVGRRNLYT